MKGKITAYDKYQNEGMILAEDGSVLSFHARSVLTANIRKISIGLEVEFSTDDINGQPVAININLPGDPMPVRSKPSQINRKPTTYDHERTNHTIIVTNKRQLENAKNSGAKEIIVKGDLAKKLHRAKKVTKLGSAALLILGGAIAAIPVTGGVSMAFAAPAAATTGVSIPVIMAVSFIGLSLLLAIYKDYEEIEVDMSKLYLHLKKK